MASYIVSLCVARGLVGEPLLLLAGEMNHKQHRQAAGVAIGAGLVFVVLLGPIALLVSQGEWQSVIVLSATLPALLLQDTLRYVAIARNAPVAAAKSDCIWLVVTCVATAVVLREESHTPASLLFCWAAGGVVGAAYLMLVLHVTPSWRGMIRHLQRDRSLRAHLTSDALLTTGSLQVSLVVAAAVAGLAGVGLVRLLQTLFGPVTLMFGLLYVEFVVRNRVDGRGASAVIAAVQMAVILSVLTLLVAGAITWLPTAIESSFGEMITQSHELLMPFTVGQLAAGLGTAAVTGLRLANRAGIAAMIRAVWACGLVGGTVIGGLLFSTAGYVWTWAIVHMIAAAVWWRFLLTSPRSPPIQKTTSSEEREL